MILARKQMKFPSVARGGWERRIFQEIEEEAHFLVQLGALTPLDIHEETSRHIPFTGSFRPFTKLNSRAILFASGKIRFINIAEEFDRLHGKSCTAVPIDTSTTIKIYSRNKYF